MKKYFFFVLLAALNITLVTKAQAAEESSYILLAVSAPTGMGSYELIFENVDENELVRVLDPNTGNRFTVTGSPYLLVEAPVGRYFLSGINMVHDSDSQRIAQLRDDRDYIEVNPGINFIGSITIDVLAIQGANDVEIQYDPASSVLRSAVTEEAELFRAHDVFVAMPGADPIQIDKSLLGL